MPEFDLAGCWPQWPQFGPDELSYRCLRSWTVDPGLELGWRHYVDESRPLPCWRTCWEPTSLLSDHSRRAVAGSRSIPSASQLCSGPPCPSGADAQPALAWRLRWAALRRDFEQRSPDGGEVTRLSTELLRETKVWLEPEETFIFRVF